jgi:hypothetical protein
MEASAFSLDMPHPHDDPIPNAARMRAIGDLNADCIVNGLDLALLLATWGPCTSPCPADLDGNGFVDGLDLAFLLSNRISSERVAHRSGLICRL